MALFVGLFLAVFSGYLIHVIKMDLGGDSQIQGVKTNGSIGDIKPVIKSLSDAGK